MIRLGLDTEAVYNPGTVAARDGTAHRFPRPPAGRGPHHRRLCWMTRSASFPRSTQMTNPPPSKPSPRPTMAPRRPLIGLFQKSARQTRRPAIGTKYSFRPKDSATAATRNTPTAALAAFVLLTTVSGIECGIIHQKLIDEHMEMNPISGWSFWTMTAGSYVSVALVIGASYFLWQSQHRKAAFITLTAVGAFMALMIGLYFYVHATDLWLPFGIEHEPLEAAGTAAVLSETFSIIGVLAIASVSAFHLKPVADSPTPGS